MLSVCFTVRKHLRNTRISEYLRYNCVQEHTLNHSRINHIGYIFVYYYLKKFIIIIVNFI